MTQDQPGAYKPFRERLDAVLRTKDAERVRAFLIEQGQWSEADQGDSAFAMWMMIAGSPSLGALHGEAERWLREHGHDEEARIIAEGRAGPAGQRRPGPSRPNRPPHRSGSGGHRGQQRRDRPHS
ncbi:MAG TPA: hypothetical protein VJN88_12275 [Ktedonobacterales bacterium]|nr:hypothetical protein [Ktedonobacterales bacterium]